jgi:hypothetical protein
MLGTILKLIFRSGAGLASSKVGPNTGTVSGTRAKEVKCEKCEFDYVYVVTCKATGPLSSTTGRQHDTVNHTLEVMLDNAVEPARCPSCAWLQSDMVVLVKQRYKRWMLTAGGMALAVSVLGLVLGIAALLDKGSTAGKAEVIVSALILVVSVGLFASRAQLVSHFDPNSQQAEAQKTVGNAIVLTQEEYERQRLVEKEQKVSEREQAKRRMAAGYGLPQPEDELTKCQFCGHQQESKNKKCVSCKRSLKNT